MICPKCGAVINTSNFNRCSRFPICDTVLSIEPTADIRNLDYIMFDFETTGINRKKDSIIEIGAVKVSHNKIVDKFSMLVNPGKDEYGKPIFINKKIEQITGITNKMLLAQKTEEEALNAFLDWIGDTELAIGQNIIAFDCHFLKACCKKYGKSFPFTSVIDTLVIARDKLALKKKEYVKSCSQESLAAYYGFTYNAHRALDDVEALYIIFNHLLDTAEKEHITLYPEKVADLKI